MRLNGNLVLNAGGQSEVDNFIIERLAALPSIDSAEKGRIVFKTADNTYYYNNGTVWMAFATGGNAAELQTEVDNLETALGSMISASGTWVTGQLTGYAASATSVTGAINAIEAALTAHNTLAELDDVVATTTSSAVAGQTLSYNGSAWQNHTLVLADISDVTSTVSEVNQLHTAGATTADFVKLHAVTSTAAELNKLTGATLSTTELNYVTGVTSAIQGQLDNKQPLDAQLTSIASLTPDATSAFLLGGAGGVYSLQDAAGFRAALGVSYTDVQPYDLDLVTLAGFAPAADSSETLTINAIATTHNGENDIMVGTGGVEGSRWTLKRGAAARTSLGLGNIAVLDEAMFIRADNAGSSNVAHDISFNNYKLTNLAPGTTGTDAINKNQLEAAITGLSWKQAVVAATSSNVNLSTGGLLTLDTSVILADGDRVLVKSQTLSKENGIYIAHSGAWVRALDLNETAEFPGAAVLVEHGAQFAMSSWVVQTEPTVVDTDPVVFAQFNGASGVVAGVGLSKVGNQIDINLGAGIVELPTDEVGIDLYDPTSSAIILTEDATTRSTGTNAKLHLLLDLAGNGKLVQSANGVKVTTNTITEAELTASVAGNGLVGGNGTALAVVSHVGTGSTGGDTPASWAGVGLVTVTADSVGVNLGSGSTEAAPGNHTHKAAAITYSNATSGIAASDVQTAIDVVEGRVDTIETNAGTLLAEVNAIESSLGASVGTDGVWAGISGTNYLNAASSVTNALTTLDSTIKSNDTAITNKVNKMYYLYTGGSSATHTVTHSLGQKFCNVTVVDAADEVIVPQSIVFTDANSLVVTLNVAIAIKVVVMGLV
jgi:hypothetical protein